ncbi:hypothetical protein BDN67DRAFT_985680 [Paxillus ammoniavirescens]|nr:hypothetical protein BDN67DRAFT_985680 [Paxillus ammoniavirescens]
MATLIDGVDTPADCTLRCLFLRMEWVLVRSSSLTGIQRGCETEVGIMVVVGHLVYGRPIWVMQATGNQTWLDHSKVAGSPVGQKSIKHAGQGMPLGVRMRYFKSDKSGSPEISAANSDSEGGPVNGFCWTAGAEVVGQFPQWDESRPNFDEKHEWQSGAIGRWRRMMVLFTGHAFHLADLSPSSSASKISSEVSTLPSSQQTNGGGECGGHCPVLM